VALTALKALWQNVPPSWNGFRDPCGRGWEGIICNGSRVIAITLASMKLEGTLSGDIQQLSELQILYRSVLQQGIIRVSPFCYWKFSKAYKLGFGRCNFNGQLPDSIGSLSELRFLYLNSNSFIGRIPNSFGNLSKLYWLDLGENKLTGTLPVSNGTISGLDMLVNTKHFHLGRNQFSGSVPSQLFHENMTLLHLLLDNNQLTGIIPPTIGLVQTLEVVRLDWNSISGSIPSNISNLTSVTDMLLSNNNLTGIMPNLTGMNRLSYLDMSNNSFEASDFPSWLTELPSLTDLIMEGTQVQGTVPYTLFSLPHLQQVVLKKNGLDGRLDTGAARNSELRIVDMQNNNISAYTHRLGDENLELKLNENPVCQGNTVGLQSYCGFSDSKPSYITPQDCVPVTCRSNEFTSPNCQCGYPYSGTFVFRAPHFTNLQNFTYYAALEQKLMTSFGAFKLPVDSVSLSNISRYSENYLEITLQIFPRDQNRFNRTAISWLGFMLSNQTFKPPPVYGTFYFTANEYTIFADEPGSGHSLGMAAIIGIAAGGSAFLLSLLCVGVIIFYYKKKPTKPVDPTYPLVLTTSASPWMSPESNTTSTLQLSGSRVFPLEELKKITNNFSEANEVGSGAFGKVYRGVLANGQLIAVKRADKESRDRGLQFRNEIELLTRVHHKNLVKMLGFCLENGELILVYEYVPNGTLKESLSGKSGIRLDWWRRIMIALGAARGLAYLHELASPPIIHRDIKSNNILLDENLNPKVSDFGLSKPVSDVGKDHITTEVRGTLLNEKSDVYSFGVLMLELITGKSPLVRGRYVVSEVKNVIDRRQDLYGLHEVIDRGIGLGTSLKGIERYLDLALTCVEELGANRPAMGEVVKELEGIYDVAAPNITSDSGASSTMFYPRNIRHLYGDESLYSHNTALPLTALRSLKAIWENVPPSWDGHDPCGDNWEGIVCNGSRVIELTLSSMGLEGTLSGDIQGLSELQTLDLSYNKGLTGSLPEAIGKLSKLSNLLLDNNKFEGKIPSTLGLVTPMERNSLSGTLDIGAGHSSKLRLVDVQHNNISAYTQRSHNDNLQLILVGNPYCSDALKDQIHCVLPEQSTVSYKTPAQDCVPTDCVSDKVSSPKCHCAYPYTGILVFRAPQFSNLQDSTNYKNLEKKFMKTFKSSNVPVDSVSVHNISRSSKNYLEMTLQLFPLDQDRFNRTAISMLGFMLSNQTIKPPSNFGPFYFTAEPYTTFAAISVSEPKKTISTGVIIGIAAGGGAIVVLVCVGAIVCFRFMSGSSWMSPGSSASTLPMAGSRMFSLDEIKKMTNNFAETNIIGSGTYGKVYRGMLSNGQLVAVKRAENGSQQGDLEFRTEIELLSRVHHKNLVRLFGFCLEKEELVLVYEYVPNGTLKESLAGKSGIRLDWRRRIKVAVGAARGLAYLHELANPPIIHRDIKSNNILLDENLNPKVSDFGLSKSLVDLGKGHITTEVKGTMGYLDPEYYMTQKLNEKSDIYSFGVLMLELITGKNPIDRGRYIVREVRNAIDRKEDLYSLHEFLDPGIGLGTSLNGFEKYVDLALTCVEESGTDRPVMGEVVKQLEDILQMAGLNPYSDSVASSGHSRHLYRDESLYSYSGASGQLPR
ncbi:hypothetical protein RDABS01_033691, partial [Bienertia sinuspersici]